MNNEAQSQNLALWLRTLEFSTTALDLCSKIDPALRTTLLVDHLEGLVKKLAPQVLDAGNATQPAEADRLYQAARTSLLEILKHFDALATLNWISDSHYKTLQEQSDFLETRINQNIKRLRREE